MLQWNLTTCENAHWRSECKLKLAIKYTYRKGWMIPIKIWCKSKLKEFTPWYIYHIATLVSHVIYSHIEFSCLKHVWDKISWRHRHGGESRDTTTTTMTHIWKNPPTSGKKIFNNSVNTWPIGIWFEAEKAERLRGFAWCVRFFKQHLIKKLLTSKQIIQGKKFVCSSVTFLSGVV